jgi:putative aminopeptidase FrvX
LLSLPTAPFREQHVARWIHASLAESGIPHFTDPAGNLVVGATSESAYLRLLRRRSVEPLRLFIAHMDHPGFHGVRWLAPNRLRVRWFGGAPVRHLSGARMRLADDSGIVATGTLMKARIGADGRAIETAELRLPAGTFDGRKRPGARTLFGGFDFRAPVWRSGRRIYCPAVDDLAGVFAIVESARDQWRRAATGERPFIGLLTRAEEVGFVGAVAHLETGWLQRRRRPLLAISLEASRTLPGADVGKGPVVRIGDRRTVFDPGGLKVLADLAARALPDAHQRRIMDGGSCEATAMTAWGIPAIGLSVPLGNYHNQGFEGGQDCRGAGGPAPEFVSIDDVGGLLSLCRGLMRSGLAWRDPWLRQRRVLRNNLGKYAKLI